MKDFNLKPQSGIAWLFKMAWRDGKAGWSKLSLFMASIVLGIAAVVSIQSFGENLKDNIKFQSKALMGADYKIDSDTPPNEQVEKIMDSLGGFRGREISFPSMALFPKNGNTKLLQVRAIEGDFPLYGELETKPVEAGQNFNKTDGALVDATVMLQLNIETGDSIKIGNNTLEVLGALNSVPGTNSFFGSIAPPVLIPLKYVEGSSLVQKGSRVDYDFYFTAENDKELERLDKEVEPMLDKLEADLDTHTSTSDRLGRRYENFGKFLNLVAFIALLLGCVGVASAIHIYIKEKLRAVALLKCIGVTRKQSFLIFLIQIAFMGFLGGIIGTGIGLVLQQLFPVLIQDLLPVDVAVTYAPRVIFMGVLLGLFMSVLFALYPLAATLYVSPLATLRIEETESKKSKRVSFSILAAIFLFIFLFSFWLLEDWEYAVSFVGGILVTFGLLAGIAHLFMRTIKKYFPTSWNFIARQSLLSLFRPQNQTLILVLAIGVGSFLISTLYFSKDLLLAQATIDSTGESPNMILLDIQNEQKDSVRQTITDANLSLITDISIVSMRVQEIKGRNVNDIQKDTTSQINHWVLNHEFRVTYRDSLIDSENLEAGDLTPVWNEEGAIPVSVSRDFAEDALVEVGDSLSFNVQGVIMPAVVGSIRTVDWSRMQLNFSLVFPENVLEDAPQFGVISTNVPDDKASAGLQQNLVRNFPNLSIIDLRQVLRVVDEILEKITLVINFMAFFTILTGIIVLIGAVRTSKYQRIRESILLRTLGARSKQIIKILALEYIYLGVLGSLSGILLSLLGSQLLAWWLFDSGFVPSWIPFLVLFPGITFLVLIIGVTNSWSVITKSPLEVLRKQIK